MMDFEERALVLRCEETTLIGLLTLPSQPVARGVLIVVGGPQYRVGSHRQYILLARQLASGGVPVMRFDYRGMGDSGGAPRSFETIDDDLAAATDRFFEQVPILREVVMWGLCDGASAALMYGPRDARICGLVLANPWVRTEKGFARTMVKHYYVRRALELSFWAKVFSRQFHAMSSLRALAKDLRQSIVAPPAL